MFYILGFIILIIVVAVIVTPKPKATDCPKCGNKVALTKNTGYCFMCRTRFIVDENNNIKEVLQ